MVNKLFGNEIRSDFPIFKFDKEKKSRTAFLDSAASAQKPQVVIDTLNKIYSDQYANIHRGAYKLSLEATSAYEHAREIIANFLHASSHETIVFTHGATEGLNLLAHSFGELLNSEDSILLSVLEHHSNMVPWQLLSQRRNVEINYVDVKNDGSLDFADLIKKLDTYKPRLLSITHISNAFGCVNPIAEICEEAHKRGCLVLVDAAQSVSHLPINVEKLDVDFLVFSGHKIYGPNGIGVLYGKKELLQKLPPFFGGGDMIENVTLHGSTFAEPPQRFEAGTPAIAEAIALGRAIEYVQKLGLENILAHEEALFSKAWEMLKQEQGIILYGPANNGGKQSSIISFNLEGIHPFDFGTVADDFNVQIRVGHHCAMPAMERFNISATARLSLGVYSDVEDIEQLLEAIRYARKIFK